MKKQFGYEKIIGKTINGGFCSEIYYYNNDNEACERKDATRCVIYERQRNGAYL